MREHRELDHPGRPLDAVIIPGSRRWVRGSKPRVARTVGPVDRTISPGVVSGGDSDPSGTTSFLERGALASSPIYPSSPASPGSTSG